MRARVLLAAGVVVLTALAVAPGMARAAACDATWNGGVGSWFTASNWSDNAVPTSSTNVCITSGTGQVTIPGQAAEAKSLTLGGSSGPDSLEIDGTWDGTTLSPGSLTLANGGSISSHGALTLSSTCSGGGSCLGGESTLTVSGGTLTNAGTITTAYGVSGTSGRYLNGNIINAHGGAIDINAATRYGVFGFTGGVLDNRGQINLGSNQLIVEESGDSTVFNDSGGSIGNGTGYGYITVVKGNTFKQGYGGIQAPGINNTYPVLLSDGSALEYTDVGTGTPAYGTIEVQGQVNLSGGPALHQTLVVDGANGCPSDVTAASGFTNAGKIVLTGGCSSGVKLTSGTLTNIGTLLAAPTTFQNVTREISGSLVNRGGLVIHHATSFDGSGATLAQTGGITKIGAGMTFDVSASGATFQLEKGKLMGGSTSQPAVFNGSVDNTGGNLIPGSLRNAGRMNLYGSYTQGSGGTLTQVVNGPSSSGYGELGVAGSASLAGTLAIKTLGDPSIGDFDTAVSATGGLTGKLSNLVGQFRSEEGFPPGWTFGYKPIYGSDYAGVSVVAATGLRVTKGGAGAGAVTSSPVGVSCGKTCDAPFFQGQMVTLTEHPGTGSAFAGWSGACSGRATTCRVTMSKARVVTATFARTH